MEINGLEIIWLGHAGFKIKADNTVIYIDPYQINESEKADLVLVTHNHYDHCSKKDVEKIAGENTAIVCGEGCIAKLGMDAKTVSAGNSVEIMGIKIRAVHAYNKKKEFHPKGKGVGYIINIKNKKIYHAGDTGIIPEMDEIEEIDIAMLPVGGTYTMNAEEAVEAAELIRPKIAIPMHYGSVVGNEKDAESFKELFSGRTLILEKGK